MIIHDCEQGTEEWLALRAGIPTASEFSNLVTSTGQPSDSVKAYAKTLAAEKFAGKPIDAFQGNYWTRRGQELEPEARITYEMLTGRKVDQVGFITDDGVTHGCSPDGLVNKDGAVEFKCLKAESHIDVLMYFDKAKKCPSTYFAQTQGEMFVCERQWVDLMFYHPELPPLIIRQTPDKKFVTQLRKQIMAVNAERDRILKVLNKL